MAADSFTEFCQMKGLSTETINILSENGFSDESDLALLTDAEIDSNFTRPLLLAHRLRLKDVVKKLQSGGNSAQCTQTDDNSGQSQPTKSDIRIVLLGKTGAGKSATANTIFGREEFPSMAGISSQTQMCSGKVIGLNNLDILVVDTPGLCDTSRPADEVEDEITRCLALSLPGPHCLIMVIKYGRLTKDELDAYTKIKSMFGENVKKHMILLVTRGKGVEKDYLENIRKGDKAEKVTQYLRPLLLDVEDRCILFNNNAGPKAKDRQVQVLMKMVTDLMATRSPCHFEDKTVSSVELKMREQARELAREKLIPFEKSKEILLKEFNEKKKSERLRELAKQAKIGFLLATAVGLLVVTGGLGSLAVAGVAGEIGAGAALTSAAVATVYGAGAIGATKMAVDTHKGRENSACSLM